MIAYVCYKSNYRAIMTTTAPMFNMMDNVVYI